MMNNFLQVGSHIHCLRCHLDVEREKFLAHIYGECEHKGKEAKVSRDCAKCLSFRDVA